MKVMHNIGLLLVRMGKFRDAVTNFQHIMHEQGDFQTGKLILYITAQWRALALRIYTYLISKSFVEAKLMPAKE